MTRSNLIAGILLISSSICWSDDDVVDLRVSLVGSAKAIDAVCPPLVTDE